MSTDLVTIEQSQIPEVFKAGGLDPIIEAIREEVSDLVPDISTKKGRDDIASMAYKVSRSKTYLDGLGKDLVSGIKAQAKVIDAERKKMRDELDSLRDLVRQPLNEYEAAEKERVDSIHIRINSIRGTGESQYLFSKDAKAALERVESTPIDETFQELTEYAAQTKDKAVMLLKAAVLTLENDERIAEEKAQAEAARIEQERIDREKRIAEEAAAKAKAEAEREAQRKIDEANKKELEAKLAAERAEREKAEAAARAKQEQEDAIRREREHEAAKKRAAEEAERKRQEDKKHRAMINNEALEGLLSIGLDAEQSKAVITAIAKGQIKNVVIRY